MVKARLILLATCAAGALLLAGCLEEELRNLSDELEEIELERRLAAVERLREIDDDRAIELLVEALEGDEELIDPAGDALAYMGRWLKTDEEPDKVNEMVEQALKDTHLEEMVRAKAAWILGEIGDRESIPALKGFTADAQAQVKADVIEALRKLGYYTDGAPLAMNDDGSIKPDAFDGTPEPEEEEPAA